MPFNVRALFNIWQLQYPRTVCSWDDPPVWFSISYLYYYWDFLRFSNSHFGRLLSHHLEPNLTFSEANLPADFLRLNVAY
ncbi:hypothetical protein CSOJ01_11835 [Colletotrichum sojae]|uniref:Uncharacterized protein n=1 Tax=Colletotrichum sojae TaxID=2175907 RepID=A0A8H6IX69_9PEZI|nr:hypothetical protein CSOJ01_11835 [Colletotrichum sojae]